MSDLARVEVARKGDLCLVRIRGEVDISNASELSGRIAAAVPNGISRIAIDLSETTYLDSAGVQLLFVLAERLRIRRHDLRLIVPEESPIRGVLELTSLPKLVSMEAQLEEAPQKRWRKPSRPKTRS